MKKIDFISDNDDFINLINLAKNDPDIREQLKTILTLESISRKLMLRHIISNMKKNKEAEEIIEAFSFLLDDKIAQKTLETIA